MALNQLDLQSGRWAVANCGHFPSKKNCKMVLMAPIDQREDLLDALVDHAIKCHGGTQSDQLRRELDGFIEIVDID